MNIDKFLAQVPKGKEVEEMDRRQKRARIEEEKQEEQEETATSRLDEMDGDDEDEQARILRLLDEEPAEKQVMPQLEKVTLCQLCVAMKDKIRDLYREEDSTEAGDRGEEFDVNAMKRQMTSLEKKVTKNQEMRVKYADQPTKFLESEIELHEEIQKAQVLATAPELLPDLIATGCIGLICGLLVHDNTDISIAVVDLIREMTDEDAIGDSREEGVAFIDALMEADFLELLMQNLERLDETVREDADCVHNTLGLIENLCALKPGIFKPVFHNAKLRQWLKFRLKQKVFDANKLYAAEILAILLQQGEENWKLFGEEEGLDMLLRFLAFYRNRDPKSSEEIELMNNYFDALCSCLMRSDNKTKFLQGEGIELMIIMLRENKLAVFGATKTLSHAMGGFEIAQCKRFVEKLGLKSLFPRFMRTPNKGDKGESDVYFEEHVCTILASLLRNINDAKLRPRILNKFIEDDYAKIERLVELHHKYSDKVKIVEAEIEVEKKELQEEEIEIDADVEDVFYLRKLNAGLFTLQLVDYIIAQICLAGVSQMTRRVKKLLAQDNRSLGDVIDNLREYGENVGEGKDNSDTEKERQHLLDLVSKLEQL